MRSKTRRVITKTIDAIRNSPPDMVKMSTFIKIASDIGTSPCATSACIAGWVVWANDPTNFEKHIAKEYASSTDLGVVAEVLLGIGKKKCINLFYMKPVSEIDITGYEQTLEYIGPLLREVEYTRNHKYFDISLDVFDEMPPIVRKCAAIRVLELLLERNEVLWSQALHEGIVLADEELRKKNTI